MAFSRSLHSGHVSFVLQHDSTKNLEICNFQAPGSRRSFQPTNQRIQKDETPRPRDCVAATPRPPSTATVQHHKRRDNRTSFFTCPEINCFPLSTFNLLQLSVAKIDIHVLGIRESEGFKIPSAKSASSPRASLHNSTKILLKNLPPLLRLRSALLQPLLLFNPNFGQVPRILEFLPRQE